MRKCRTVSAFLNNCIAIAITIQNEFLISSYFWLLAKIDKHLRFSQISLLTELNKPLTFIPKLNLPSKYFASHFLLINALSLLDWSPIMMIIFCFATLIFAGLYLNAKSKHKSQNVQLSEFHTRTKEGPDSKRLSNKNQIENKILKLNEITEVWAKKMETLIGPLDKLSEKAHSDETDKNRLKASSIQCKMILNEINAFNELNSIQEDKLNSIEKTEKLSDLMFNQLDQYHSYAKFKNIDFTYQYDMRPDFVIRIDINNLSELFDNVFLNILKRLEAEDFLKININDILNAIEIEINFTYKNDFKEWVNYFESRVSEDFIENWSDKCLILNLRKINTLAKILGGSINFHRHNYENLTLKISLPRKEVMYADNLSNNQINLSQKIEQENEKEVEAINDAQNKEIDLSKSIELDKIELTKMLSEEDKAWLNSFESCIIKNLSSNILTISWLANEFNMSESTLRRQIKSLTGRSPIKYLQGLRFNRAMEMIKNNEYNSITRIAHNVGYKDLSTFSRIFKKHFGKAPSEVMQE